MKAFLSVCMLLFSCAVMAQLSYADKCNMLERAVGVREFSFFRDHAKVPLSLIDSSNYGTGCVLKDSLGRKIQLINKQVSYSPNTWYRDTSMSGDIVVYGHVCEGDACIWHFWQPYTQHAVEVGVLKSRDYISLVYVRTGDF